MSYITKYGSFWGILPQTSGRLFWVAPTASYTVEGTTYTASDSNDGLSPERALLTVDFAVGLCAANVGDTIVMLPGSHSISATIAVDVAGITIVGIPGSLPISGQRHGTGGKRLRTQITSTQTAGIIFTVSAVDVEIAYIHMAPPAAGGRGISLAPLSGAANRAYIHDCTFGLVATASVTTFGVNIPLGVTADLLEDVLISRCHFISGGAATSGANGPAVNILGTTQNLTIELSTFELKGTAAWADVILSSNPGTVGLFIKDCDFHTPTSATTVMTDVLELTSSTIDGAVQVYRCYFPLNSDAFQVTAVSDAMCAECYTAGDSATTNILLGVV